MQSARSTASTAAKVTFKGDTKKVKLDGGFDELVERTRNSFSDLPEGTLKFFYVDEENDLISVSSQADLTEALESTTTQLRLTVAGSTRDAHSQLTNSI